ncbi:MAG: Asp23/Gls24 family envelope stress response protein [Actinobacteria bacterium HGW-Actinobacteria-9]|jgi:uncharacterized alkaline shock family protein YloU|nr:MAG: Asp23/Gls24 family envelope stress response protein [Actinobacteria bacterium HGW-Actinobacteria-9]
MTDEIKLDGLGLAPGVLETIITLAAEQVPGVASICTPGLAGKVGKGKSSKLIEVTLDDAGVAAASLHLQAEYGTPLRDVARGVQEAVADAIRSQVGVPVNTVDVFIDGIVFQG